MTLDAKYKFLIAGGSNTAITFALYALLVEQDVDYNLALTITYVLGIALGFLINRLWTFTSIDNGLEENTLNSNQQSVSSQFGRYILVYLFIFVVNLLTLNLLVQLFGLNPIVSQLFAIGLSTVCSYFLQKSWVFKQQTEESNKQSNINHR